MPERAEVGGVWTNVVTVADLEADGYVPGRAAKLAEIEDAADRDNADDYEPSFAAELREQGLL